MVIQSGTFSLELVDAHSRQTCPEHTHGSTVFVQVDPRADYYVRLQVVDSGGGQDPNRVYLLYVNINDNYIGYRQCLHPQKGSVDVGLYSYSDCGIVTGTHQPMQFQDARLWPLEQEHAYNGDTGTANFWTDMIHMGKVTVKIYQGVLDHGSYSAFGNNCIGDEAYQPGPYIETMTLHCWSTPEMGHTFLFPKERELLQRAFLKRSTDHASLDHQSTTTKKMKTETGFVAISMHNGTAAVNNTAGGMEGDYMMQQQ